MDHSPYVAVPGIVVILIVLYAATVSAEAIAKGGKAREEEIAGAHSIAAVIPPGRGGGALRGMPPGGLPPLPLVPALLRPERGGIRRLTPPAPRLGVPGLPDAVARVDRAVVLPGLGRRGGDP